MMDTMDNNRQPQIYSFAGGEIDVWLDPDGGICLQTRNEYQDPVELGEHEALELAEILTQLVREQRE